MPSFIRNLSSNAGMAQQLAFYEGIAGDWRYILGWRENMYKITPEDIMKVAKTYFTKSNRTVGTLVKERGMLPPLVKTWRVIE